VSDERRKRRLEGSRIKALEQVGREHSPETANKIRRAIAALWADPEYRARHAAAMATRYKPRPKP
jgi:hypothetical protein